MTLPAPPIMSSEPSLNPLGDVEAGTYEEIPDSHFKTKQENATKKPAPPPPPALDCTEVQGSPTEFYDDEDIYDIPPECLPQTTTLPLTADPPPVFPAPPLPPPPVTLPPPPMPKRLQQLPPLPTIPIQQESKQLEIAPARPLPPLPEDEDIYDTSAYEDLDADAAPPKPPDIQHPPLPPLPDRQPLPLPPIPTISTKQESKQLEMATACSLPPRPSKGEYHD